MERIKLQNHFHFISITLFIFDILLLNTLFLKKESRISSTHYLPIREKADMESPLRIDTIWEVSSIVLELMLYKDRLK